MLRAAGTRASCVADELAPAWVHAASGAPRPAWPRSERLPSDRSFQVVAAEGGVYFGSSSDDAVYAHNAQTGTIRWRRITDGPIRFAAAVCRDRLFVAGDDGHLYALAAKDGAVLWKHCGGPSHARRLGNERMISKWPARGGPVVVDDVVYYAAGIWPSDGIYIYALDKPNGQVRWQNDERIRSTCRNRTAALTPKGAWLRRDICSSREHLRERSRVKRPKNLLQRCSKASAPGKSGRRCSSQQGGRFLQRSIAILVNSSTFICKSSASAAARRRCRESKFPGGCSHAGELEKSSYLYLAGDNVRRDQFQRRQQSVLVG